VISYVDFAAHAAAFTRTLASHREVGVSGYEQAAEKCNKTRKKLPSGAEAR
jgi:hypothetical protein